MPSSGHLRSYQVWYRNSAKFCTSRTFDTTNGVTSFWTPWSRPGAARAPRAANLRSLVAEVAAERIDAPHQARNHNHAAAIASVTSATGTPARACSR